MYNPVYYFNVFKDFHKSCTSEIDPQIRIKERAPTNVKINCLSPS